MVFAVEAAFRRRSSQIVAPPPFSYFVQQADLLDRFALCPRLINH